MQTMPNGKVWGFKRGDLPKMGWGVRQPRSSRICLARRTDSALALGRVAMYFRKARLHTGEAAAYKAPEATSELIETICLVQANTIRKNIF